ncbi:hypothetical protein DVT68_18675 [Dyella solisilvae]|uniref:Dicarboxylate transport domain-containing protein n=1 Tax=Dyella solisilvae TaxID=1920168 RepID=A0A370K372_9GAMM|nr:hypothetical protein [Dyella solisilvae]RDI97104.1 hypothetical protein DVT68_18675 [Dyella solisilvae]
MRRTSSHLLLSLGILLGMVLAMPARADIALGAKVVGMPGLKMQDVQALVGEDGQGGLKLTLKAAKADMPVLGWKRVGLDLQGVLQRDVHMRWLFDGTVQLVGAPGGAFGNAKVAMVIDEAANTLQIDITQGQAGASTALPLDQPTHAQISLKGVPTVWLQGLLGAFWSGRTTAGKLDADMALDVADKGFQASGQFALSGGGFDTPSGTLAGQAVNGNGRVNIDTTTTPSRIDLDASLRGGELLLGPIFARLPDHPVQVSLAAATRNGAVDFNRLRVADADALQFDGALAFNAKGELQKLKLAHLQSRFPAAYQRYGQAWLATLGMRDMRTDGQLSGSLDLDTDGLRSFAFETDGLDVADGAGRLAVKGLRGSVDWKVEGDRPPTTLGWQSLQIYRIAHGAAQGHWQSRGGELSLQRPLEVPVLNGRARIGDFAWRPAAARGRRLSTSLAFAGIDMAAFSRAMGWPEFPGTLGGAVPALRWVDDRVELEGGLSINVFGGFVDITRLSMQGPFGQTSVVTSDVQLRQLDLAAMTSVFDFGSITGRMDGSINQLRMVNWSPVAFQANLLAGSGGKISQRAVNNLTAVGGGGGAAGLQGAMLKLFKTFNYKRIGLTCTLEASVCHMGGLDGDADGYTIVEGSGLPHLQVIGHQTQVDWPTLVRRVRAAIEGNGPEVH